MRMWTNGTETIIAADEDDAAQLWAEHTGEILEDYPTMEWDELDADAAEVVTYEAPEDVRAVLARAVAVGASLDGPVVKQVHPARLWERDVPYTDWEISARGDWWCLVHGRGVLSSREY